MAKNIKLMVSNGTEFEDVVHPKTNISQVDGLLDYDGKIKLEIMNSAVLGGGGILGGIDTETVTAAYLLEKIMEKAIALGIRASNRPYAVAHQLLNDSLAGRYFQVQRAGGTRISTNILMNYVAAANPAFKQFYGQQPFLYQYLFDFPLKNPDDEDLELENGDFIVFNNLRPNIDGNPTIDINDPAVVKKVYDQSSGTPDPDREYIVGSGAYSIIDRNITFYDVITVNETNKTVTYDSINVNVIGDAGTGEYPFGGITLVVGGNTLTADVQVENINVAGQPAWSVSATFNNETLTFTQAEWDAIYKLDGSNNNIYIDFGIINNTYGNASLESTGVIKIATEEEVIAGTINSKAVTPLGAKKSVETFGMPLATEAQIGNLTNGFMAVNPYQAQGMINKYGGLRHFSSLTLANGHPSRFVAGTIVAVNI